MLLLQSIYDLIQIQSHQEMHVSGSFIRGLGGWMGAKVLSRARGVVPWSLFSIATIALPCADAYNVCACRSSSTHSINRTLLQLLRLHGYC